MRFPIQNSRSLALILATLCAAPFAAAITPADLAARLARNEPVLVVDVRSATAYTEGHVPGAINIPLSLLPHKQLPASHLVVVYGDGLGVIDDTKALAAVSTKSGVKADAIAGGYAAWLAETRRSTAASGITRERVPGITYDQLVAASKSDVVLVDLRTPVATTALAPSARTAKSGDNARTAASAPVDLLGDFARKLSVPVVAASTESSSSSERTQKTISASASSRAASVDTLNQAGKLLVLVADNETDANEAARQLRAKGHYRFTVLIGGTEAILHEGKTGSGRMDSGITPTSAQP